MNNCYFPWSLIFINSCFFFSFQIQIDLFKLHVIFGLVGMWLFYFANCCNFSPEKRIFLIGLQCFDCKPLFASFVCRALFAIRDTLAVCTLEKISTMTEWTWFELGKFILSAMIVLCGVKFPRNNIAIAWRKHRAAHSIWWLAFTIRGSACDTNISCF